MPATTPPLPSDTPASTSREASRRRTERLLWVLVVTSLVFDVVLTQYGLLLGLTELNPVLNALRPVLGTLVSMVLLKFLVVGIGVVAWVWVPRRYRVVVPFGVACPWCIAVVVNAATIVLHVT